MAPEKKGRLCSVEGCGRKHAANGFCLMHYKRNKKHGTVSYMWGGKAVGRPCIFCERIAVARDMCYRHYQMWRKHGDPEYSDKKKKDGVKNGEHIRNGYKMVTDIANFPIAQIAGPEVEKKDRYHSSSIQGKGYRRKGSGTRKLEHRIIAGAKFGEIVHHIDGNKMNNSIENLHVFNDSSSHTKAHKSLEQIGYELFSKGIIVFDTGLGVYRLEKHGHQASA